MCGLYICILVFGIGFGLWIGKDSHMLDSLIGGLYGAIIGIFIWIFITIPLIKGANSELIDTTTYKIENVGGHYWETIPNDKKIIHYVNKNKELCSYTISRKNIEYSNKMTEPTLIIEKRNATGWFMNFWLAGDTEMLKYRVIMPYPED